MRIAVLHFGQPRFLDLTHKYKKEPLVGKSYYCLNHEAPEVVYELNGSKRVRRWSGHDWR